jgi:hypothetical protein
MTSLNRGPRFANDSELRLRAPVPCRDSDRPDRWGLQCRSGSRVVYDAQAGEFFFGAVGGVLAAREAVILGHMTLNGMTALNIPSPSALSGVFSSAQLQALASLYIGTQGG